VKKLLIVSLSLVLVLAMALTANAGIRNTIHDYQSNDPSPGFDATAQRGMCSYCHIPHSSAGDRLWPTAGQSQERIVGVVGMLCASCHMTAYMNLNSPTTDTRALNRGNDIYNTGKVNHVLLDDGIYGNNTNQQLIGGGTPDTQFGQLTVWPYCGTTGTGLPAGYAKIECSSCHNPHNETIAGGQSAVVTETNTNLGYGNDFLRSAMYNTATGVAFCEYCHEEKTRARTSGPQNSIGTGTHPVGATANAGSAGQADIHIESLERATLRSANIVSSKQYDQGIGWVLGNNSIPVDFGAGLHLTSYATGGVTCQSCHLVHNGDRGTGTTWDQTNSVGSYLGSTSRTDLAASDDGYANILAIENDANGGGPGYTYPTEGSNRTDYNDLCIDCHETTPSVGTQWLRDNNANRLTADQNDAGTWRADAHPVNIAPDGRSESGFDLTVINPSWAPAAKWAGQANTKRSDAFSANGRWNGAAAPTNARSEVVCLTCHSIHDGVNGTPILRTGSDNFCQQCHTSSIGGVSHPVAGGTDATVNTGAAMKDNPDGATWPNGDNLPLANYYNGDTATGTSNYRRSTGDVTTDMACHTCHAAHDGSDSFMLRITDDNSRICTGCHTDIVAQAANYLTVGSGMENPANYIAEYQEAPTARLGSHYTGTVTNSTIVIGETRWAYTGAWTDTTSATKQTSHWNGGVTGLTRMQCQSCHTPHDAATGLVEGNTFDGNQAGPGGTPVDQNHPSDTDNNNTNYDGTSATRMCATPNSALLLGSNARSKMCATCHWPKGTHVTTIWTVAAKPDPRRSGGTAQKKKYRDYCTRTSAFIISILNGAQEQRYLVYDLIANDSTQDSIQTPESPTNFPPLFAGVVPTSAVGEMVCDSCHAPHGAATGSGAFILEDGTGDASTVYVGANQRVATRNYQELCWKCHDK